MDYHSDIPVYKQIVRAIEDAILSDELKREDELPSVRKLALNIKVNPNTIAKAYFVLQSKGYVYSRPGIGYRVANSSKEGFEERLKELDEVLERIVIKMSKFGLSKEEIKKRASQIVEKVFHNERN